MADQVYQLSRSGDEIEELLDQLASLENKENNNIKITKTERLEDSEGKEIQSGAMTIELKWIELK